MTLEDFVFCITDPLVAKVTKRIISRTIASSSSEPMFKATSFSSIAHHLYFMKARQVYLSKIAHGINQLSEEYNQYMTLLKQSSQEWLSTVNSISGYTLPSLVPKHYRVQKQLQKYDSEIKLTQAESIDQNDNFFITGNANANYTEEDFNIAELIEQAKLEVKFQQEEPSLKIVKATTPSKPNKYPAWDTTLKISLDSQIEDDSLPHSILRSPKPPGKFYKRKLLSPPRQLLQSLENLKIKTMQMRKMKFEKSLHTASTASIKKSIHLREPMFPSIRTQLPEHNDTQLSVDRSTQTQPIKI